MSRHYDSFAYALSSLAFFAASIIANVRGLGVWLAFILLCAALLALVTSVRTYHHENRLAANAERERHPTSRQRPRIQRIPVD